MKLTEKVINTKLHFKGRIINLREDTVELENGAVASREIVEHPGGVCVIGADSDGNFNGAAISRPLWQNLAGSPGR